MIQERLDKRAATCVVLVNGRCLSLVRVVHERLNGTRTAVLPTDPEMIGMYWYDSTKNLNY